MGFYLTWAQCGPGSLTWGLRAKIEPQRKQEKSTKNHEETANCHEEGGEAAAEFLTPPLRDSLHEKTPRAGWPRRGAITISWCGL